MVADKLSRLDQTIQKEWSVLSEVFQSVCSRWHPPCLPQGSTTSYLCLCPNYQIPWPGQWMHSACHGRIWMRMPSHQQPSWASSGKAAGLPMQENHYDCSRVAQHALVLDLPDHSMRHSGPFLQSGGSVIR